MFEKGLTTWFASVPGPSAASAFSAATASSRVRRGFYKKKCANENEENTIIINLLNIILAHIHDF